MYRTKKNNDTRTVTFEAKRLALRAENDKDNGVKLHTRIAHFLKAVQTNSLDRALEKYTTTTREFDHFVEFYKCYCENKRWKVFQYCGKPAIEMEVNNANLRGRLDVIFETPNGDKILVDWKRSICRSGYYFAIARNQLMLYEEILSGEPYHVQISKKWIVNLHPYLENFQVIELPTRDTRIVNCERHLDGRDKNLMDMIEKLVSAATTRHQTQPPPPVAVVCADPQKNEESRKGFCILM